MRKIFCLLIVLLFPVTASALTWIEQVEQVLTCTSLAHPPERALLDAPFIPDTRNPRKVKGYFQNPPKNLRHARMRQLTMLAATGWWADLVNDQRVRVDAFYAIQQRAAAYAKEQPKDVLWRQISRCAMSQLVGATLEIGEIESAELLAIGLANEYATGDSSLPVEDWPLILTLRELVLEPRARTSTELLGQIAWTIAATEPIPTQQPYRASRMTIAAARASLATGKVDDARNLTTHSMVVSGTPPTPEAIWRAFPVLYDMFLGKDDPQQMAGLISILGDPGKVPPSLNDRGAAFEALDRASIAAEAAGDYKLGSALNALALQQLTRGRDAQPLSHAFYRYGWERLGLRRFADWGELGRYDPASVTESAESYFGTYDTMVKQAQDQFVANTSELQFQQYKIDNSLYALAEMYPALPKLESRIEDATFRMAQLRSFGRITLATIAAELDKLSLDSKNRFHVDRFFSLSTQTGTWLRGVLASVYKVDPAQNDQAKALWDTFFLLDVFYEETAKQYSSYADYVRKQVPSVAELVTPRPQSVRSFQKLLKPGEALISTLVTPHDLYVWSVTPRAVELVKHRVSDREVAALVTRLRAGLIPSSAGGKTTLASFDAAAAHELHRLIFEPVKESLNGVTHVVWFGHGPLGSVPPAVLVAKPPAKELLSKPGEFKETDFLVDHFAFSALADLSLFPVHRNAPASTAHEKAFLGVGAPMLDTTQVEEGPRSKSYDLAGAMDDKALTELPLLAESVDEIRALAAVLGESKSTVWIGPEANEKQFKDDALRGYKVLALATHGFKAYEIRNVPEPALMLALAPEAKDRFDGLLTASEIAALELDADVVVLSACNTAAADGRPRSETFTGLTQAFFTAGAKSLVASHWPVMSGAAVQLSVATVEASRNGEQSLAVSLQQAMQAARSNGAESAIESHPSYWGPFVVVGDGSRAIAP